jgi:DNA-binding FadR family transcriptional regulator
MSLKKMESLRFKLIKQSRVSEEVAGQLKQSILLGQFKTGEKLPSERKFAEEFEVSRVAIREALRTLCNSGFVSTRQGSAGGVFVTNLTFEQLANTYLDLFVANKISIPELHEVRVLIEPEVARSAAQNVSAQYAGRLQAALDAEELPLATLLDDIERKQLVHVILAEMCGNRFFEGLVKSMMRLGNQVVEAVGRTRVRCTRAACTYPSLRPFSPVTVKRLSPPCNATPSNGGGYSRLSMSSSPPIRAMRTL